MRAGASAQTWTVWIEVLVGLAVVVAVLSRSADGAAPSIIFILGAAAAAFTAYVGWRSVTALTDDRLPSVAGSEDRREALEYEKNLAVAALKELDADATMGKVDARDLPTLKASAEARALALIKQIREEDEHWRAVADRTLVARGVSSPPPADVPRGEVAAPEPIEPSRPTADVFDDRPVAWTGVTCGGCGFADNPADGRFCTACGRPREAA